ncbi:hypothetical protein Tco_0789822 [Tanacetum coccineum]
MLVRNKKNETFWYKVLDQYNEQANRNKLLVHAKNMLTGKWTPMNREVGRFNSLVNETKALSGEKDEDWLTRVEIIRNRGQVTGEEPELFEDDEFPHSPGKQRIAKSQCSTNSSASSGSNLAMFQDTLQQQYELDHAAKIERLDCETSTRVELINSQKVSEDLKVLQIDTSEMDLVDATIIDVQKAWIRDLYQPQN